MFNPFDEPIAKVYGPYVVTPNGGPPRRQVVIHLHSGRRTSMSYARWQMTQHLGRKLDPTEHVDHVNENPLDDRIENYQLLTPAENARKSGLGKPSPFKGVDKGFSHGTQYGWQKRRCGCPECAAAKRAWNDERNARRRKPGGYGLRR